MIIKQRFFKNFSEFFRILNTKKTAFKRFDDNLISRDLSPNTIGATHVSPASSECVGWFHTAIIIKPFKDSQC